MSQTEFIVETDFILETKIQIPRADLHAFLCDLHNYVPLHPLIESIEEISPTDELPRARRFRDTGSERAKRYYGQFLADRKCSVCNGTRLRVESAAEPLQVRHERDVPGALAARTAGEHVGRVGHGRHPLGTDKRADHDRRTPRRAQGVDEGDLVCGRHDRRLVLQAVSGTDVVDEGVGSVFHSFTGSGARAHYGKYPDETWHL